MKIRFEVPNKLEITFGKEAECDACGEADEGRSVGELLLPQYALATGGLAKDHRPLITFPDNNNFHVVTSAEYRRLLLYLTSVPSLLEAEMGFHIIIDRRKDRWNSVKTALLRISEFFPGNIHAVYVLRPASFLQKALSEVSSKLFKEEFRFRVLVCSSIEELYEYFDRSQLTPDLGGELQYSHSEWIQQRIALEKFSILMKEISNKLDDFMHTIVDCDMGNDPTQTKELLDCQENRYNALKTELASATSQGEELLAQVRKPNLTYNIISHVAAVERLLVQLEETEKQFDNFWQKHSTKLNHWLRFRTFLLNFKQMQATLDNHLKTACDMTEVGETASRVESLIEEANDFEKLCNCDLSTAADVIEDGDELMQDPLSSVDHIESKCEELKRTSILLVEKIQKRNLLLNKARELMDRIDKANEWCTTGVEILAGEGGLIAVDKLLEDANSFGLKAPEEFREMLMQSATQETRALVTQVAQRVEDVWLMVTVKRASLHKAAVKPARPVQSVPPQSAVLPTSPAQMETSGGSESSGGEDAEARRLRRGHVLAELLQTERVYVQELGSILKAIGRVLQLATFCTMKYGKYDLHKSSANLSIGTSYSWYYKKNENPAPRKKKRLLRATSDSTLFSDYANQITIFDKDRRGNKKCKKSISDVGKNTRVKYNPRNIKPVYMEPFVGNFFYGKPIVGYEFTEKTEEKIAYLPDSDTVTASEAASDVLTLAESLTTAPTVVDAPEFVKNPLYGCSDSELHIPTPDLSASSRDSQLKSSSCTELRKTMGSHSKDSDQLLMRILKDYKRIMKEWNNTITDHYSTVSASSKRGSTSCRESSSDSYVPSSSTLSCSKPSRCMKSVNNKHYSYAYTQTKCKRFQNSQSHQRKTQSLHRNQTFSNWTSTLQTLKKKSMFWKMSEKNLSPSECECLEAIYEDYDKRLHEWCETVSRCTSSLSSGYKEEIEKPENQHLLPTALVGQADVLFGNLHELFTFHQDIFLKDLERSISATELVALCFVEKRDTFFRLYSYYCQNIPRSERLRETLVDTHLFLQACQLRLGHKLPLAAYLLKPVQRITKYQLLLKDLLRYSECGSMSTGLQQALDCMLVVLKCVNDSMHQIAITGVPVDLSQQGELLMQGSFFVVSENKRDIRLRIRPRRRHIFLYEKSMLFCKPATKNSHNKATYHFKHDLQMSQIGLTESVKGDPRKFEVWRQGRSEVHTISAPTAEAKRTWVDRIKRVLLDQLKELKGERVRQYGAQHRTLIQASSWDLGPLTAAPGQQPRPPPSNPSRTASCDTHDEPCWSTDPSEDEEDEPEHAPAVGCSLVALSDYTAVGASEVSLREGQQAELLKVGCAGWWYVRLAGGHGEGWAPAAYLDQRKTSRSSSRSHDRLHDHH